MIDPKHRIFSKEKQSTTKKYKITGPPPEEVPNDQGSSWCKNDAMRKNIYIFRSEVFENIKEKM